MSAHNQVDLVPDEASAYRFLEDARWPDGKPQACPKCGGVGRTHYLAPKDGSNGRATRTGANSARRVWFCGHCRTQFSVLTNTVLHGTRISMRSWVLVLCEVAAASQDSIPASEIARTYEITPESARHMMLRIREAMKREPLAGLFGGVARRDGARAGNVEPREFLREMLAISPADAEDVRRDSPATPARARRKNARSGQHGPTADYGDEALAE